MKYETLVADDRLQNELLESDLTDNLSSRCHHATDMFLSLIEPSWPFSSDRISLGFISLQLKQPCTIAVCTGENGVHTVSMLFLDLSNHCTGLLFENRPALYFCNHKENKKNNKRMLDTLFIEDIIESME